MKKPLYLLGYSALLPSGLHTSTRCEPWSESTSVADIRREQVMARPYPTFGKLELTDKLAFAAASLVFGESLECSPESTGISLAVVHGSIPTDIRYQASVKTGFPSPALFSATLPSSPIAEPAICYGLKGPVRVVAGAESHISSLLLATKIIECNKAESMLVLWVSAIDSTAKESSCLGGRGGADQALALLLSARRPSKGGAKRIEISTHPTHLPRGVSREDDVYFTEILRVVQHGKGICSLSNASWNAHFELYED